MVAALLVARHAQDGQRRAQDLGLGRAEVGGAVPDLRQHRHRHAQQRAELGVPAVVANVVEQGAAGVGRVGGMHPAAGQPPDQEAVDRAEAEVARLGPGAGAVDVVEQQAGTFADQNNRERMVSTRQRAHLVPFRADPAHDVDDEAPAKAEKYMRSWLASMMWADVRSENSHSCWSLILFSMSPRAQYQCS